ncbi:MAG: hypothetical protein Q8T11_09435 [Elusimicrobiota bacterium]|nr:hypothetical protein [Elusimicrobiota bacterium]
MEPRRTNLIFVAAILSATLAGGGYFAYRNRAPSAQRVAEYSASWKPGPRATLTLVMDRYGPPDAVGTEKATWYERGPWKRITIHGREALDFLEQTVGYVVPAEAARALSDFDHGLRFDRDNDELSATSNAEALNHLALNLADELCAAKRTTPEANDLYLRTARLAAAGKSSPYTEGLLFKPYRRSLEPPRHYEFAY